MSTVIRHDRWVSWKHAIGEPCGEWVGGPYICGCRRPEIRPAAAECRNCGHRLVGHLIPEARR